MMLKETNQPLSLRKFRFVCRRHLWHHPPSGTTSVCTPRRSGIALAWCCRSRRIWRSSSGTPWRKPSLQWGLQTGRCNRTSATSTWPSICCRSSWCWWRSPNRSYRDRQCRRAPGPRIRGTESSRCSTSIALAWTSRRQRAAARRRRSRTSCGYWWKGRRRKELVSKHLNVRPKKKRCHRVFRSRLKWERRREEETRFQSRLLLFSTIRERSEEVLSIANDAYISEERIHSEKIRLNAILLMMLFKELLQSSRDRVFETLRVLQNLFGWRKNFEDADSKVDKNDPERLFEKTRVTDVYLSWIPRKAHQNVHRYSFHSFSSNIRA